MRVYNRKPSRFSVVHDGFLQATIARGRSNTPMRPFGRGSGGIAPLKASEIADLVSYIRTWMEQPAAKLAASMTAIHKNGLDDGR